MCVNLTPHRAKLDIVVPHERGKSRNRICVITDQRHQPVLMVRVIEPVFFTAVQTLDVPVCAHLGP
jgi:hypothetical protein